MAIKGAASKQILFNKLMEIYPESFWEEEGKILRVPMDEDGARIELKISLTAAKTNLKGDQPNSAFAKTNESSIPSAFDFKISTADTKIENLEPTEEEKNNVAKMLASLGL